MAKNQYADSSGVVQRETSLNASNKLDINDSTSTKVMGIETHGADGDHAVAGRDPIPAKGLNAAQLNLATNSSTGTGAQQTIAHGLTGTPSVILLIPTAALAAAADAPFISAAANATNIYITAGSGITYNWVAII